MTKALFCTRCLTEGRPVSKTPGSVGVEIVLWLFFCLPGLIYSIWRLASRYDGCASCGSRELVPVVRG